jgi:ABC-2 type transport system permease protein
VQLIADATDPNTATTVTNYASNIILDYQTDLNAPARAPYSILPQVRMLYNPQLKGAYNFVPGVMAMILIIISAMMTSVSIVREKEINTMEVLLVSPLKPLLFILSKAIPYMFLSLINVSTILIVSVTLLEVPINGSLLLLMGEGAALYYNRGCIGVNDFKRDQLTTNCPDAFIDGPHAAHAAAGWVYVSD